MPDFARRFFARCAQIYEAYLDGTLIEFVCIWQKISRKSRYKRDSESTYKARVPKGLYLPSNKNQPFNTLILIGNFIAFADSIGEASLPAGNHLNDSSCKFIKVLRL